MSDEKVLIDVKHLKKYFKVGRNAILKSSTAFNIKGS